MPKLNGLLDTSLALLPMSAPKENPDPGEGGTGSAKLNDGLSAAAGVVLDERPKEKGLLCTSATCVVLDG